MKNLVIIPTYNEKENIEKMIETVFALSTPFDLLIVDDGSPDGTADLVRVKQFKFNDRLHLVCREGKLGLGTAYIRGFRWALQRNYNYIFEMDCDFSHPPEKLVELHAALVAKKGEVAVGSRYIPGGKLKNWPADRIFISRRPNFYLPWSFFLCPSHHLFACPRRHCGIRRLQPRGVGSLGFR